MNIKAYQNIEGGVDMVFEIGVAAEPVREKIEGKEPNPARFPHSKIALIYKIMSGCVGCIENHEHPCCGVDPVSETLISRKGPDGKIQFYLTATARVNKMGNQPVDLGILERCPAAKIPVEEV